MVIKPYVVSSDNIKIKKIHPVRSVRYTISLPILK